MNGTGFVSGSVVKWNGSNRTTTFGSATQLTAAITAADIAAAGTAPVTVFNPTPGGGTSGPLNFTITAANPVPAITSLTPATATAGTAAFNLTVTGTGFINGSVVKWNGSNRTTTFGSATQLTAAITAADIVTAGTAPVTVFNPTPGGGTSGPLNFTITAANPVPAITSLTPATATAGTAAFSLKVNGTGFVSGSVVKWNGSNRTTTFGSATQLTAAITAADIAAAGTAPVTVFNPTPGGGTSGNSAFTITATNPVPTISSLSPATATAGTAAFTLTVNGAGFENASLVKWNGSNRTTTFVSATQLRAAITAADIATAGTAQGTVFNPAPGGGTSGNSAFTITGPPSLTAAAYAFDEGTGSTTADASGNGNTGQIKSATWTTSAKHGKALSFNGSNGYVDLGNPSSLQSTGSMTWSAWVYASGNPPDDGQIIAKSNDTAGWQLKTSPDTGKRTFGVAISGTSAAHTQRYSKTVYSLSTWYHVAGVYNASAKTLDIYVNGVLDDGVLTGTIPLSQYIPALNATIGERSGGFYFKGVIDDVRVYNRALSQAEIQNDMNTGVTAVSSSALTSALAPAMVGRSEEIDSSATDAASLPQISALSCSPRIVNAGGQVTCELQVTKGGVARIQLASSSSQMRIPALVATRTNQSRLTFQASVDAVARQQEVVLTATLDGTSAQDTIQVAPASTPILTVPDGQFTRFGAPLSFTIAAVDPSDLPFRLTVGDLPAGAMFDPVSGRFEWTPNASQAGTHRITFGAVNSAQQLSTVQVTIEVDSGAPVLSASEEFACSPGATASLGGKWLTESGNTFSDPSGNALDLGSTKVRINGQNVPVLFASPTRVNFLCPALEPGTQLSIVVENASAASEALSATMQTTRPAILSLDGSGRNQGLVFFAGTNDMVVERTPRIHGRPAQPGDQILIWSTGLGPAIDASTGTLSVKLGGVNAEVQAVRAVPGYPGMYTVRVRVPEGVMSGDTVPVQLQVATPDGTQFNSNSVTVAVEAVIQ